MLGALIIVATKAWCYFFDRHYPIIWILKAIRLLIVFVLICTITYKFLLVPTSRGVSLLGLKNNRLG